jgi:hypothetical protein
VLGQYSISKSRKKVRFFSGVLGSTMLEGRKNLQAVINVPNNKTISYFGLKFDTSIILDSVCALGNHHVFPCLSLEKIRQKTRLISQTIFKNKNLPNFVFPFMNVRKFLIFIYQITPHFVTYSPQLKYQ